MNTVQFVRLESVYASKTLGVPMMPGHWVSDTMEYVPVTRLRMSCGGGLGGAQWFEYVNRIPLEELAEMKTAIVTTWRGKRKLINMSNVVDAEEFTIVKAVCHSLNSYYPDGDYLVARLVADGSEVSLIDEIQYAD